MPQWVKETKPLRAELEGDDPGLKGVQPWTGRRGVRLQGLPVQCQRYNFLFETLDLRVLSHLKRNNLPLDADLGPEFWTDIRQSVLRSQRNGQMALLSGTRAYSHSRDRLALAEEVFNMLGWGQDIDISAVHNTCPDDYKYDPDLLNYEEKRLKAAEKAGRRPAPKRSPAQRGSLQGRGPYPYYNKAVDLAANSCALPDLALILVPLILLFPCFEHAAPTDPSRSAHVCKPEPARPGLAIFDGQEVHSALLQRLSVAVSQGDVDEEHDNGEEDDAVEQV